MMNALYTTPFNVLWRSALVRAPRLTPTQVLKWTDPKGPYPIIVDLPSRGDYRISCYVFIKRDVTAAEAEHLPVVLDFHGGGFYLGSCLEQAPFCSMLARELGAVVITVDYRMGPVSKFPAAIEDAEDVLRAILQPSTQAGIELRSAVRQKVVDNFNERKRETILRKEAMNEGKKTKPPSLSSAASTPTLVDLDLSRLCISGFSSGGNLALNLALDLSAPNTELWPSVIDPAHAYPIPFLLYYPSFDARKLPSERNWPPRPENMPAEAPGFWTGLSDLLAPTYLPREQAGHVRASPGLADIDAIHGQARMLLVLPANDSLAEQSEAWVKKVEEHGSRVKHLRVERFPEMKHGWTQFPDTWLDSKARKAKEEIYQKTVDYVRRIWEGDETAMAVGS